MEELSVSNKKRVRDDSAEPELDLPEVKRLKDDLLSGFIDESDPDAAALDLDSVMKSFEVELSPPVEVVDLTSSVSGESLPDLGYLLEASDDELGLPPSSSVSSEEVKIENLKNLYFKSVGEQAKYLRICNSNQQTVETILNACGDLVAKYKADTVRVSIAALLLSYMEICLNNALQVFTNYTLRRDYLEKITTHLDNLINDINDLDTSNPDEVATLTNHIQSYNEAMTSYTNMSVNSRASQEFSRNLKNSGIEFQTLVKNYQATLGFGGLFEHLTDEQKLLVYDSIIEASGRGKVLNDKILKAIAVPKTGRSRGDESKDISIKGAGMLLYNAASITWDVYTSDHPIQTAMRDAVKKVASEGGAVLQEIVEAAIVTGLVGIEATSLFVTGIGFVVGLVASYILGEIAGEIFDLIFGSGGTKPLPNEGFIFYVADMPNGKDLAKQIANKPN